MFQIEVEWGGAWYPVGKPEKSRGNADWTIGGWKAHARCFSDKPFRVVEIEEPEIVIITEEEIEASILSNGEQKRDAKTEEVKETRMTRAAVSFLKRVMEVSGNQIDQVEAMTRKSVRGLADSWRYAAKVCAAYANVIDFGFTEDAIPGTRNEQLPEIILVSVFGNMLIQEYMEEVDNDADDRDAGKFIPF